MELLSPLVWFCVVLPIGAGKCVLSVVGSNATLPWMLDQDAKNLSVEWSHDNKRVLVWRHGYQVEKHVDRMHYLREELSRGDVSLRITDVQLSDAGIYRGLIPSTNPNEETSVQLVVCALSKLKVWTNRTDEGLDVKCEAKCWSPKPEVFWLDDTGATVPSSGKHISTDDCSTVMSVIRLKDSQAHSKLTCRVQHTIRQVGPPLEIDIQLPAQVEQSSTSLIVLGAIVGFCVLFIVYIWKCTCLPEKSGMNLCNARNGLSVPDGEKESLLSQLSQKDDLIKNLKLRLQERSYRPPMSPVSSNHPSCPPDSPKCSGLPQHGRTRTETPDTHRAQQAPAAGTPPRAPTQSQMQRNQNGVDRSSRSGSKPSTSPTVKAPNESQHTAIPPMALPTGTPWKQHKSSHRSRSFSDSVALNHTKSFATKNPYSVLSQLSE